MFRIFRSGTLIATGLFVVLLGAYHAHAQTPQLRIRRDFPTESDPVRSTADFDDVYGRIEFLLGRPLYRPINSAGREGATISRPNEQYVSDGLRAISDALFSFAGRRDGTYTITLDVYDKSGTNKPLARVPVIAFSSQSKTFFFINRQINKANDHYDHGELLLYHRIEANKNKLRVTLSLFYSDRANFDLTSIRSMLDIQSKLGALTFVGSATATAPIVSGIENLINTMLGQEVTYDEKLSLDMAFVKKDAANFIATGRFAIASQYQPDGRTGDIVMFYPIEVRFLTAKTRITSKTGSDGKQRVDSSVFWQTRVLGTYENSPFLAETFRTSEDASTRSLFAKIDREFVAAVPTAGTKEKAGNDCNGFYAYLSRFFHQTDRAAFYYSFLLNYGTRLQQAADNGVNCFGDPMKREMADAQLPTYSTAMVSDLQHVLGVQTNLMEASSSAVQGPTKTREIHLLKSFSIER